MDNEQRHEEVMTVKFRKVFYDQDLSHWEAEWTDHHGNYGGGLSGATFTDVWNEAGLRIVGAPDDVGFIPPQPNSWIVQNESVTL